MKRENNIYLLLPAVILSSICLISCDRGNLYVESERIPGYIWNDNNIITFRTQVNDTVNAYDINLIIRTDKDYPYRNMFLFIKTVSPEKTSIKDTVEYFLADEKGNWYGSGLGDVNDLSVPLKSNILFPMEGTYTFNIQHGMREKELEGVIDIGMQIKKRKN